MRKLIILLLFCQISFAQYNLFARQNFAYKVNAPTYNTYIGGVSGTIASASSLATKLAISVGNISNFTIVGSDIKCKITGSYAIPASAFNYLNTPCTYYTDTENLVNYVNSSAFYLTSVGGYADFTNALTVANDAFRATNFTKFLLKNTVNIGTYGLSNLVSDVFYIPNCTNLGGTALNNSVFEGCKTTAKIYANPTLATNNAGGEDGDIAYARARGCTINYVTNFTAPSPVTTLAAGTMYNTAIQLNFTPPSSTNTIDYYEVYVNGIYYKNIVASGEIVTGLNTNTSYNFSLVSVDIFYNKSIIGNTISAMTLNTMTDADAITYIKVSGNVNYEVPINTLFVDLKSNSLYTKMKAFYPFLGTTATQHKWNAKNPLDTDAAFRLTFGGTSTYTNSGYAPNGTTGFANTFVNLTTLGLNGNFSFGYTQNVSNTIFGDRHGMGAYSSGTNWTGVQHNTSTQILGIAYGGGGTALTITSPNTGLIGMSVSGTSKQVFFRNTSVTGTVNGTSVANVPFYIGALDVSNTYYNGTNGRYGFTFIAESYNSTEMTLLIGIIDTFENAVGRKTW